MSKLGKTPITIPKGVEIKVEKNQIQVKGPKGTLTYPMQDGMVIKVEDGLAIVSREEGKDVSNVAYGLLRATLNNMIVGVSKGFEKKLSMVGVGYRAAVQGQKLDLQVGNSHPTHVSIPKGVQVAVDKSVTIIITGVEKQVVGQFAAQVRGMKPPEPYKGKGIRYEDEYVRKKAGKAAKAKTAAG
ncbi:MAG: 50S ribosomal protein L6 [Verrucomicrobia bacterium]|nr:50S ribosomal protein L6 [Verrucomicrobiota bacterium]